MCGETVDGEGGTSRSFSVRHLCEESGEAQWPTLPRAFNAASYFVDRHLKERGSKIAYIDDRGTYDYEQLAVRVNRAGNLLKKLGVEPEQRVMLCLFDGIDLPALFFGAIKIGAVAVPVSTFLKPSDYDYMLRDSRSRVLVLSAELAASFAPILPNLTGLKAVVVAGVPTARCPSGCLSFEALSADVGDRLDPADTVVDDSAFWLYTSGSTGTPKAAVHLQGDPVYTAVLFGERTLGIKEGDVIFSASKLSFAFGLGNAMSFPLHAGATAVLMAERPTAEAVMRVLHRHQPTIFCAVPTLYANILAGPALDRSKGSQRLRLCASGGEPLPEHVSRGWVERFGVEIFDGMGSTEILHNCLSNRPGDIRYGTSGKPVPGYDIRLLDENGSEVPDGVVGDMWCRGPSISPGYWNKRATSASTLLGRWVRTGDKFMRDGDGYYRYVGRGDDMLKSGALWVSPFEVESALMAHPEVLQAAVVAAPDAEGLAKPKAFVVLRDRSSGSAKLAEELKLLVRKRLAHYKCPRWIEFRSELPMTATGKIQRYKLRRQ
jgi:4-hydroxybenzoate-CoA ligase